MKEMEEMEEMKEIKEARVTFPTQAFARSCRFRHQSCAAESLTTVPVESGTGHKTGKTETAHIYRNLAIAHGGVTAPSDQALPENIVHDCLCDSWTLWKCSGVTLYR